MSKAFQGARQNIARYVAFPGNDSEYATHAISQAKQRTPILRLTFRERSPSLRRRMQLFKRLHVERMRQIYGVSGLIRWNAASI